MKTIKIRIVYALAVILFFCVSCTKDDEVPSYVFNEKPDTSGKFSVSNTRQVIFSRGNLQYQAFTNTWRFAEHQFDYVGGSIDNEMYGGYGNEYGTVYENGIKSSNNKASSSYNGWIDLFAWGTSGYPHGATCYQPWSVSTVASDFFAYGSSSCNLYDQSGNADWGFNSISNGTGRWRTLTKEEWVYVLDERNTSSGIRYVKATIDVIKGVILLPDDWNSSVFAFNSINSEEANYNSNTIGTGVWSYVLETKGAVFLPAAGGLNSDKIDVYHEGFGGYWSSSPSNNNNISNSYNDNRASQLFFNSFQLASECYSKLCDKSSVRLVQDVE